MTNKENLTKEEMEQIKETFQENEILDEDQLKILKKNLQKATSNNILLATLYVQSYFILKNNTNILDSNLKDKLNSYLDGLLGNINILRSLVQDYGDGEEIGSYYVGEHIKDFIINKRVDLDNFLGLFSCVMGEEE